MSSGRDPACSSLQLRVHLLTVGGGATHGDLRIARVDSRQRGARRDAIALGECDVEHAPADFGRDAHVSRLDVASGPRGPSVGARSTGGWRGGQRENDSDPEQTCGRWRHAMRPSSTASVTRWMCATASAREIFPTPRAPIRSSLRRTGGVARKNMSGAMMPA